MKSILHYYLELLNNGSDYSISEKPIYLLSNVIKTMQLSRNNRICCENFNNLDFSGIPLVGIKWSINGKYPSTFNNCSLGLSNFVFGHSDAITVTCVSNDDKFAVTYSYDGQLIVWEIETGMQCEKIDLSDYKIDIIHIEMDRDITIYATNGCYTYNIKTHEIEFNRFGVMGYEILLYSHDNRFCLIKKSLSESEQECILEGMKCDNEPPRRTYYIYDNVDNKIVSSIWGDVGNKVEAYDFTDEVDYLETWRYEYAAFSDNNSILAINGYLHIINLWDLKKENVLIGQLIGHHHDITAISFTRNGKYCISGDDHGYIIIWDMISFFSAFPPIKTDIRRVSYLIPYDNDRHFLCSGTLGVITIDLITGCISDYIYSPQSTDLHNRILAKPSISSDEKLIITGFISHAGAIWELCSKRMYRQLGGNLGRYNIMFDSQLRYCLIYGYDSIFNHTLWDLQKRTVLYKFANFSHGEIRAKRFSIDGKFFMLAYYDGFVEIYVTDTCTLLKTFSIPIGLPQTCFFIPNTDQYIIACTSRFMYMGSLSHNEIRKIEPLYFQDISAIALSSNGRYLVYSTISTGITVFDLQTNQGSHCGFFNCSIINISDDGNECVLSRSSIDHEEEIWNLTNHTLIGRRKMSDNMSKYIYPGTYCYKENFNAGLITISMVDNQGKTCEYPLYVLPMLEMKNCTFKNCEMDNDVKNILKQYNAKIE